MAERIAKSAAVAAVLLAIVFAPTVAWALGEAVNPSAVRAIAQEVTAGSDFGSEETSSYWRLTKTAPDPKSAQKELPHSERKPFRFGGNVSLGVGRVVPWVIGIIGALLAISVLVTLLRHRAQEVEETEKKTRHPPATLFGLDIRPESLPEDAIAAARDAWEQRAYHQALSLLYRSALSHIATKIEIEIPRSATEGQCVHLVSKQTEGPITADLGLLTTAWQQTAYGDRPISTGAFDELLSRWQVHLRPVEKVAE